MRAMVSEAFADARVSAVIAHTLPERNASNRVLEWPVFDSTEREERAIGAVWRFSLTRLASGR
jgi:[ribosomal protein S5]-alanine N-acetyltransferase